MDLYVCQFYMMVKIVYFKEWSAALTVSSICLSIISMLASAKKKSKPKNDQEFCKRA